jgi:hypothetical protein
MFDETILDADADKSRICATVNWTDYPVMNMHPHAWPLYTTTKLIGVDFTPQGLTLTPTLPLETYRFSSPLLGFEKTPKGYSGWYQPLIGGTWTIEFRPPEGETAKFARLEVNGSDLPVRPTACGFISFSGDSGAGTPLRWRLVVK